MCNDASVIQITRRRLFDQQPLAHNTFCVAVGFDGLLLVDRVDVDLFNRELHSAFPGSLIITTLSGRTFHLAAVIRVGGEVTKPHSFLHGIASRIETVFNSALPRTRWN